MVWRSFKVRSVSEQVFCSARATHSPDKPWASRNGTCKGTPKNGRYEIIALSVSFSLFSFFSVSVSISLQPSPSISLFLQCTLTISSSLSHSFMIFSHSLPRSFPLFLHLSLFNHLPLSISLFLHISSSRALSLSPLLSLFRPLSLTLSVNIRTQSLGLQDLYPLSLFIYFLHSLLIYPLCRK